MQVGRPHAEPTVPAELSWGSTNPRPRNSGLGVVVARLADGLAPGGALWLALGLLGLLIEPVRDIDDSVAGHCLADRAITDLVTGPGPKQDAYLLTAADLGPLT